MPPPPETSKTPHPLTKSSSSTKLPPLKIQTPHSSPLCQKTLLLDHNPNFNTLIINLDPERPDLNVLVVNLSEGYTNLENAVDSVTLLNTVTNDETSRDLGA